ncbi:MAG: hypothetical protein WAN61_03455 [Minisyncoccia bacterium]
MKQASLQIKTSIKNATVLNNIDAQKIIFNLIISVFVALSIFYVVILGNMVANIVQRRTLQKEATALSDQVNSLELSYLSISGGVNLSSALSLGFAQTTASFATRKSLGYNFPVENFANLKNGGNEI